MNILLRYLTKYGVYFCVRIIKVFVSVVNMLTDKSTWQVGTSVFTSYYLYFVFVYSHSN